MSIKKNYLQLEFTSGNFFEYSKEPKEDHEKFVSSKGKTSYRKYHKDGVTGTLDSVSIRDTDFGQEVSMNIKNGDDVFYVPVSLADQRGNVDTYAESLIKLLPSLNKGDTLTVRGYNFTPEDSKYPKIGISISRGGEKLKGLTNAYTGKDGVAVAGDIPAIAWKKDALGKNKPTAVSLEAKNDYLLEVLKVQTERLKWVASANNTTTTPSAPAATPQQKTPAEAFDTSKSFMPTNDDLPF